MVLPEVVEKDKSPSQKLPSMAWTTPIRVGKVQRKKAAGTLEDFLRATTPVLGTGRGAAKIETGMYLSPDGIFINGEKAAVGVP